MRFGRTRGGPPSATTALLLAALPLLAGCPAAPPPPPPPPPVSRPPVSAPAIPPGPAAKPVAGGTFNRYFPKAGDGYSLNYTQEKAGLAQAELTKDGKRAALLTISDLKANPTARKKYAASTKQIAGYPAATLGSTITSIMVEDRWQVQAQSSSPSFTAADREAWIQRFDLAGLASTPK